MFSLLKSSLFIIIASLIVGCGGGAKPAPTTLPSWYLNPNASNPIFYYGVGEGSSKAEAKVNALAQVGGKISVSVSSSMDISTTTNNDDYNEKIQSNTKSSIEKIKFTGVTVIENAMSGGKFYTYLKVDRGVLFKAQNKAMQDKYNKVNSLWKHAKNSNIFAVIKNKSAINSGVDAVMSALPILKAINAEFNEAKYKKVLSDISEQTRNANSKAMVYVTHKDSLGYQEVVKKYISSYGMTLVDNPKEVKNKSNLLMVEVSKTAKPKKVKTSDPRLRGASFADVVVTLTTRDSSKKVMAQNRIKVVNISKEGYKAAVVKTPKFEREIKRRGIVNILFEKISK